MWHGVWKNTQECHSDTAFNTKSNYNKTAKHYLIKKTLNKQKGAVFDRNHFVWHKNIGNTDGPKAVGVATKH